MCSIAEGEREKKERNRAQREGRKGGEEET
jgi:hypothetical protein